MTTNFLKKWASQDTIIAEATAAGKAALSILRLSGSKAILVVDRFFKGEKSVKQQKSHTLQVGTMVVGEEVIDQVVIAVFRNPRSFTGEDCVEITTHGSPYIVERLLTSMIGQEDLRLAYPGEFTQRALKAGKLDLAQAEAVADLIHADHALSHRIAMEQLRGGFSSRLQLMRQRIIELSSLLELEMDFIEEDVTFADPMQLQKDLEVMQKELQSLLQSFALGNVIKKGIPVVITGAPNVGKSTLLNGLLEEKKALVSPFAGTTRDTIEASLQLKEGHIRLIDTAGLRVTQDHLEAMGIERAKQEIEKAHILLHLFDLSQDASEALVDWKAFAEKKQTLYLLIGNKADKAIQSSIQHCEEMGGLVISAQRSEDIGKVKEALSTKVAQLASLHNSSALPVLVNRRHYEALLATHQALAKVLATYQKGEDQVIVIFHMREAQHYLGEITGEITSEDILDNIFANFCIGK